MSQPRKTIYLECTQTAGSRHVHTGIQRVVRNLVREARQLDDPRFQIAPVVFRSWGYRPASQDLFSEPNQQAGKASQSWLSRLESFVMKRPYLRCPLTPFYRLALFLIKQLVFFKEVYLKGGFIKMGTGDLLLLVDSSWYPDLVRYHRHASQKHRKYQIVALVHDLIPITHPESVGPGTAKIFHNWLSQASQFVDGFICNSQYTASELQNFLKKHQITKPVTYFHLSGEIQTDITFLATQELQPEVIEIFQDPSPVFLTVSTIEPRKNHLYLLNAFDQLWASGMDVKLCLIGKYGWKCEEVLERIKAHPLRNKKLFWMSSINDQELDYCYRHASVFVWPSLIEGFGLPLVEALQRNCVIMAGDIPINHEVCDEMADYFDLDDPSSIVRLVQDYLKNPTEFETRARRPKEFLTWTQASRDLIEHALYLLDPTVKLSSENPRTVQLKSSSPIEAV